MPLETPSYFPVSARAAVVRAEADAERDLRDALSSIKPRPVVGNRVLDTKDGMRVRAALANYVSRAVSAFAAQEIDIARANPERLHLIDGCVDGRLEALVYHAYGELDLEPFKVVWHAVFDCLMEMRKVVKHRPEWTSYLQNLAAAALKSEKSRGEIDDQESQILPVSDDLKRWRRSQLKEYRDRTGKSVNDMASLLNTNARVVQAIAAEDRSRFKVHHQAKLLKLINVSMERWYGAPERR